MPAKKKGAPASASKRERPKKPHGLAGKGGHKNHAANSAKFHEERAKIKAVLAPPPMERCPSGSVKVIDFASKPKIYDPALVDRICFMFETDPRMSLVRINTDPALPLVSTFYDWLDSHPDASKKYARAREVHSDLQAEELSNITRNPYVGEIRVVRSGTNADGTTFDTEEVRTIDNVDRARLIVDTDKWILSKLRPKKYGITPLDEGDSSALDELLTQFRSRSKAIEDADS